MNHVFVAAAFLTRVRMPVTVGAVHVGSAARWFPLIGGVLGGSGALVAWLLTECLGSPPAVTAALVVGLGAWITGAIHLDGLADTADGFGGGRHRDDALRIMRDPAIGAFGATTLAIVIVLKIAALMVLLERGDAYAFLVGAPTMARWTIPVLAASLPYARVDEGLGRAVAHGRRDVVGLGVATATTAVLTIPVLRMHVLVVWALAVLTTAGLARAAHRHIGGVTGDVFGAGVELTETVVLLSGVLLTGRS